MDELASGRQLRDDLRQLKERYPELTTPAAQARLAAYMSTQIDDICIPTEESPMPAKDQRGFGEDLVLLTVRIPKSDMAFIDQHVLTLQRQHRYTRQGRSEAARDLIQKGIDSIENPPQAFPVVIDPGPQLPLPARPAVEPTAPSAVSQDDGPRRRRVVSPLDQAVEDMPLTMEPPAVDVTQESVVPAAAAATVETARPKAAAKKRATRTTKGR